MASLTGSGSRGFGLLARLPRSLTLEVMVIPRQPSFFNQNACSRTLACRG